MGTKVADFTAESTGGPFKFAQPGEFITLLRNKTSVLRAGATMISGLTGPVTFPKQVTTGAATWRGENPGTPGGSAGAPGDHLSPAGRGRRTKCGG